MKDCVSYLRSNPIYIWISTLLSSKDEIKSKIPSSENGTMKRFDWNSTNTTRMGAENSTENRWFDRLNQKRELEPIKEESNNNKYYIIALLLLAGLTFWYFGDEILPHFPGGFPRWKPKSYDIDPKGHINLPNVPIEEKTWWESIKDWFDINRWRNRNPESLSEIEL
uniref:Uncharacterized protein n=1 Tax=Russula compacta TaxID=40490 RepID=A0A2S0U3R8_9AGAM|nr:hypothetical protein [Russula compacta]AWB36070.1 hypothetical protein [Russula compacta]